MRMSLAAAVLWLAVVQPISAQDWEPERWRRREGVQIRIGRDYHLPADQIASWPIIVIGGSATIDGRVEDELVVIGGPVRIGPTAQVRADVVSFGGDLQIADAAQISGEIHDISVLWPDIEFALRDWFWRVDDGWWAFFALAGTLVRVTLTLLAVCFVALIATPWTRRIQERVADAPLASGFIGLATELLATPMFLVLIVGLVVTIIGIPLLILVPFAVLAFLVAWLAGFTAVAAQLGRSLRAARSASGPVESPVADAALGVLLLSFATMIGNLLALGPSFLWPLATAFGIGGFVIEYLAWTVGLGAALLAPFGRRWRFSPPPVPSTASANA